VDETGVIAPSDAGAATETSQAGSSNGSEQVASESSQGQTDNAGGEQSFSESGKDQGTDTRRPAIPIEESNDLRIAGRKFVTQGAYWVTRSRHT
jgi:hypothetical protein